MFKLQMLRTLAGPYSWQVSISKYCTGEPETVTLELPGKGPISKVHATFTFRPTEGLHDSASDIERDAFGFEIAPLQRETYRAHKDVLQKIGKDDRHRIDELLETGLHMNHQQVCRRSILRFLAHSVQKLWSVASATQNVI